MRFINYSDCPLRLIPTFEQDGSDARGSKPNGIWFSIVDAGGYDSWKGFCEKTVRPLKPHHTEIVISKEAQIIWLRSAEEIDQLSTAYSYYRDCPEFQKSNSDYARSSIRWDQIAQKYDGIIVMPFCEQRRLSNLWYFTWDCASGCIWSKDAIDSLRAL